MGGRRPGRRRGGEADCAQWAIGRNAVADREHSVTDVRGESAVWFSAFVEHAEVADQIVEIHAEAGGGDDHTRRYAVAVGEDHTAGFDRLHSGDDLHPTGSYGDD